MKSSVYQKLGLLGLAVSFLSLASGMIAPLKAQTLTLTFLHEFDGYNGNYPETGLLLAKDGNFYGTTIGGGGKGSGVLFRMTPQGKFTTLIRFGGAIGCQPLGELVQGRDGNIYGTTSACGTDKGVGTVFRVTPSGAITTLVSFNYANGAIPQAGLVEGRDGNFYGTTYGGGQDDLGTIFRITPQGKLTTLVHFTGANGGQPLARLIQGRDGNFYGTTSVGGTVLNKKLGTVFRMTADGSLTTLVNFTGTNGDRPISGLLESRDGKFYGTTSSGKTSSGDGNYGTVFQMSPNGELNTLVTFNKTNGSQPKGELLEARDGNIYGTTTLGGGPITGRGTIFRLSPNREFTTLFRFVGRNGADPSGGLVEGRDGNLYGTLRRSGVLDSGVVYRLNLPTSRKK